MTGAIFEEIFGGDFSGVFRGDLGVFVAVSRDLTSASGMRRRFCERYGKCLNMLWDH
jgi:hypothetical protein